VSLESGWTVTSSEDLRQIEIMYDGKQVFRHELGSRLPVSVCLGQSVPRPAAAFPIRGVFPTHGSGDIFSTLASRMQAFPNGPFESPNQRLISQM
jgi:hypothetical protein